MVSNAYSLTTQRYEEAVRHWAVRYRISLQRAVGEREALENCGDILVCFLLAVPGSSPPGAPAAGCQRGGMGEQKRPNHQKEVQET